MTELLTGLRAANKGELLAELAHRAAASLSLDARDIARRLATREALGSTGTGAGIAVPHARVPGLAAPVTFFARLDRPLAFDSIDGRPVDLVFLLLSPEDAHAPHLAILAAASRRLRDPAVVSAIRAAATAAAIIAALGEITSSAGRLRGADKGA